jgi:PAS domain S-box-containing protein
MEFEMLSEAYFYYSATPEIVIKPLENTICAANAAAGEMLGCSVQDLQQMRASDLFISHLAELIVFTQEAMEHGSAWNNRLQICLPYPPLSNETLSPKADEPSQEVNGAESTLPIEAFGRAQLIEHETLLFISFHNKQQLHHWRQLSAAHNHYLSGMGHWNRVSQVFQEFERENQLILDAAGEGIYGVDAQGITTFVNPAAERILGFSAAELAGRNMHSMIHYNHGDGSHFGVENCPIFAAFKEGKVQEVEDDIFWSKSGQPVYVDYTSTPIRDNGVIVGAVVVFRDISQKKADKKRLLEALAEVESLKNRLELENAYLQQELNSEFNHHQIVGKSPAIQHVVQQIELVAPTDATVLICGESGTGKELIARAIHEMSQRSQRPLIRVNCAAIPEDLFESEFFGHTKGAFTGASADRPGRFELADGGTLFLDEVGEIPLHLQGKLLRVLQEQQFERVGDATTRHVDVRIIAATNQNLKAWAQSGRFREDLYFRLNVFPIESVPLRQRQEDIALLTQHFLEKASKRANKNGLKVSLSELETLKAYHWPGNIRELENVIERQVILARGDTLHFDDLKQQAKVKQTLPESNRGNILSANEMREQDRRNLILALERCQGKVFGAGGAAELLAMKPTTVASRIKKFQIDLSRFKQHTRAS